jgi:transcriptional regulator with XRE-family HTH domain
MAKELRSASHRALIKVIVTRREALGLTQEQLAAKMKVDKGIVWRTEAGERIFRLLEVPMWAKALEMTRQEFIEAVFGAE